MSLWLFPRRAPEAGASPALAATINTAISATTGATAPSSGFTFGVPSPANSNTATSATAPLSGFTFGVTTSNITTSSTAPPPSVTFGTSNAPGSTEFVFGANTVTNGATTAASASAGAVPSVSFGPTG